MKTIEHLRDYLLENYVDEFGDLDISGLDFSDFDGDVATSRMEVKGSLFQDYHEVKGNLYQGGQGVRGHLYQSVQEVKGTLNQSVQKVGGHLYQYGQEVQGGLSQGGQEVQGDYTCRNIRVKGDIFTDEPTKLLKEITTQELAEMGYNLKKENLTEEEHEHRGWFITSRQELIIPKEQYFIDFGLGAAGLCACGRKVNYQFSYCPTCGRQLDWQGKE